MTNLFFLRDLLYAVSQEKGGSIDGVLDYLGRRLEQSNENKHRQQLYNSKKSAINPDGSEEEEEPLETDRNAVRILSIHASKGLEFPIVFLPDLYLKTVKISGGILSDKVQKYWQFHAFLAKRFEKIQDLSSHDKKIQKYHKWHNTPSLA